MDVCWVVASAMDKTNKTGLGRFKVLDRHSPLYAEWSGKISNHLRHWEEPWKSSRASKPRERMFWAEGPSSAKALGWEDAWCVWGIAHDWHRGTKRRTVDGDMEGEGARSGSPGNKFSEGHTETALRDYFNILRKRWQWPGLGGGWRGRSSQIWNHFQSSLEGCVRQGSEDNALNGAFAQRKVLYLFTYLPMFLYSWK